MIRGKHADSGMEVGPFSAWALRIAGMTSRYQHGLGARSTACNTSVYALVVIATCIVAPLAALGQDAASEKSIPHNPLQRSCLSRAIPMAAAGHWLPLA